VELDISIQSTVLFFTGEVTTVGLFAICNSELKNLKSLNINGTMDRMVDGNHLNIISDANFVLESLDYGDNRLDIKEIDKLCESKHRLKKLCLDGFYEYPIRSDRIVKISKSFPKMHTFHIRGEFNREALTCIGQQDMMEDLFLSFQGSSKGIEKIGDCVKLKRLSLDTVREVDGISDILNRCLHIEYLFMKGPYLRDVKPLCGRKIKEIELMSFEDIRDSDVRSIVKSSKGIEKLTISICKKVSLTKKEINEMITQKCISKV